MLILSPEEVILTEELAGRVWKTLMVLEKSRSHQIRSTGIATLKQLISVSFEGLKSQSSNSYEVVGVHASCMLLLKNVIELAAGRHELWRDDVTRQQI